MPTHLSPLLCPRNLLLGFLLLPQSGPFPGPGPLAEFKAAEGTSAGWLQWEEEESQAACGGGPSLVLGVV